MNKLQEHIAQTLAEAARVAIQVISLASAARTENLGPRLSGPIMKQSAMLQDFKKELTERVFIKKNWLGKQALQLLKTLNTNRAGSMQ